MIKIFACREMFVTDKTLPPGLWKGDAVTKCCIGDPEAELVTDFEVVSEEYLGNWHDKNMVKEILRGTRRSGHGTMDTQIAQKIVLQVSSFIAAAKAAKEYGIAFSPTSGFHHAHYNKAHGYCTFNAIPMAAKEVGGNVLVLDGDAHWGDGVVAFIKQFGIKNIQYVSESYAPKWLFIEQAMKHIINADFVIYQAGADALERDILSGGAGLSMEEFRDRDRVVFEECRHHNVPIVWNMAGGYGAPSMKATVMAHYSTWRSACDAYSPSHHNEDPYQTGLRYGQS